MKENKFKKYRKLVFAVIIILAGLYDVWNIQNYISEQKYLPTTLQISMSENESLYLEDINIDLKDFSQYSQIETVITNSAEYRLTEKQFFKFIFDLVVGFMMILYGMLLLESWFIWNKIEELENEKV